MLKNYIKTALRNMQRERAYAIINIAGLAIGLAICLLVMAYIVDELSFDNFHKNSNRLYRVIQDREEGEPRFSSGTTIPFRQMLIGNVPEIKSIAQITSSEDVIIGADAAKYHAQVRFADPEFFDLFSFRILRGDSHNALSDPSSIVLTESMAKKLFGSIDVVGKAATLTISGKTNQYLVSAVAADVPSNSSIEFELLLSSQELSKYIPFKLGWNLTCSESYVLLRDNADPADVTQKILAAARIIPKKEGSDTKWVFALQPLCDVHLNTNVEGDAKTNSPTYAYLLGGIGLIVLILACINFTTLAIGRSQRRVREIGVRKVMGASQSQLCGQLLWEAILISAIALVIAFVLAELLLPTFNELSGKRISSIVFTTGGWSVALVLLVVTTAAFAGGYPAWVLSRSKAVEAVRGKAAMLTGGGLTRVLVALQFTLSAALIVITLTMSSQLHFMQSAPLGFNKEQLVMLRVRDAAPAERLAVIERLRNNLHESDGVVSICASGTGFTGGGWRNGTPVGPDSVLFSVFLNAVDAEYFRTTGVEMASGSEFREGAPKTPVLAIVNETLVSTLKWDNPIGKSVPGLEGTQVIGVVKDFHIQSLAKGIEPIVLLQTGIGYSWQEIVRYAFLRISPANIPATMKRIQEVWGKVAPDLPFTYEFMDEHVAAQYGAYQKWADIMQKTASLAVIVACFGVFGLTTLAISRRRKELGIRKVLGAKSGQLVALLNREFILLVFIGTLIAWPIAYFAASKWLSNFAYRAAISPWPFVASTLMLLAIVVASVSVQAVRAAMVNPTDSIRCE